MKYRKRSIEVEAIQWFKNGDHPEDNCIRVQEDSISGGFLSEGEVVRYFRHPRMCDGSICSKCRIENSQHGWIDTAEGEHRVCPGDWIIKGIKGEFYPCKPDIFKATYDVVGNQEREGK